MNNAPEHITTLLSRAREGDEGARDAVLRETYSELRRLAQSCLRGRRGDLTTTALVHEASIRLLRGKSLPGDNRHQFFAYVATSMRSVLADHARRISRQKRGGDLRRVQFSDALVACVERPLEFLALDEALRRLEDAHSRKARVVELRYFAGLSLEETAEALEISLATAKRDWTVAKIWLLRELTRGDSRAK